MSEEALRAVFARFGDIIYVKIPQGKGCGFVQFVLRTAAEQAMSAMNGQVRTGCSRVWACLWEGWVEGCLCLHG